MIPKVRTWLENQGFTLEMRAASAFRAAGFEVHQSSHYIDQETGKGREIDVVARDPNDLGVVEITFVVECKSSKNPWVLLCSPDTVIGYNRLFAYGALSRGAIEVLVARGIQPLLSDPWFKKDGLVGYSLRQALSGGDVAYAAAVGVAKACDNQINPSNGEYAPAYACAFPVIVVDTPILQCSLSEDGNIAVQEVEEGEFLFIAKLPRYFGTCIRVVSISRLQRYANAAKASANALRETLRVAESRVVNSWGGQEPA